MSKLQTQPTSRTRREGTKTTAIVARRGRRLVFSALAPAVPRLPLASPSHPPKKHQTNKDMKERPKAPGQHTSWTFFTSTPATTAHTQPQLLFALLSRQHDEKSKSTSKSVSPVEAQNTRHLCLRTDANHGILDKHLSCDGRMSLTPIR